MKDYEKEIENVFLDDEHEALEKLVESYEKALKDIIKKVEKLNDELEELEQKEANDIIKSQIRSKVYQLEYQNRLKKEIENYLHFIEKNEIETIDEYLRKVYGDGYMTEQYRLYNQGVTVHVPINQDLMAEAVNFKTTDMTFSQRVYKDVDKAKKTVLSEITRGFASGMSNAEIARNIRSAMNVSRNKACILAQNEGARVRQKSIIDYMAKAKAKGADIVKEWNATLDFKTRPTHQELDGQRVEVENYFEYQGGKVFAPKQFGIASEDINCRCTLTSVPRWDLTDKSKRLDNITGDVVEVANYGEWLEKYGSKDEEYIKEHPKRKFFSNDLVEQHERYMKVLGKKLVPKSLYEFQELKKNKEKWDELKRKYTEKRKQK